MPPSRPTGLSSIVNVILLVSCLSKYYFTIFIHRDRCNSCVGIAVVPLISFLLQAVLDSYLSCHCSGIKSLFASIQNCDLMFSLRMMAARPALLRRKLGIVTFIFPLRQSIDHHTRIHLSILCLISLQLMPKPSALSVFLSEAASSFHLRSTCRCVLLSSLAAVLLSLFAIRSCKCVDANVLGMILFSCDVSLL